MSKDDYLVPSSWNGIDDGRPYWRHKFCISEGCICYPLAPYLDVPAPYVSMGRLTQQWISLPEEKPCLYSDFLLSRGWQQFDSWEELEQETIREFRIVLGGGDAGDH